MQHSCFPSRSLARCTVSYRPASCTLLLLISRVCNMACLFTLQAACGHRYCCPIQARCCISTRLLTWQTRREQRARFVSGQWKTGAFWRHGVAAWYCSLAVHCSPSTAHVVFVFCACKHAQHMRIEHITARCVLRPHAYMAHKAGLAMHITIEEPRGYTPCPYHPTALGACKATEQHMRPSSAS